MQARPRIGGWMAVAALLLATAGTAAAQPTVVLLETSKGNMEIELYPEKAPLTVANFLGYVRQGFYDGTIFHRTVYQWIIQGGGYDVEYQARETGEPIRNEADNGLKNVRGTIAMARLSDPDTADSQFFINLADNDSLDHRGTSKRTFGYCVFGKVVKGMDVADAIGDGETHELEDFGASVPVEQVVLVKASVLTDDAGSTQ